MGAAFLRRIHWDCTCLTEILFGSEREKASKSIEGKRSKGSTGNLWLCYVCATGNHWAIQPYSGTERLKTEWRSKASTKRLQLEIADTNNSFVDTKGNIRILNSNGNNADIHFHINIKKNYYLISTANNG